MHIAATVCGIQTHATAEMPVVAVVLDLGHVTSFVLKCLLCPIAYPLLCHLVCFM